MQPQPSIIIPFYNEEDTIKEVLQEVVNLYPEAEIIAVNDGSKDKTWEIMQSFESVRSIQLPENRGQSAAMYTGLKQATREYCVLMDGDGQNDPSNIKDLVEHLEKSKAQVVVGYRAERKDKASRRWASKIANGIRRSFINDGIRDTGCSLKSFRREAVDHLVPFNGMHRYMAAMFKQAGLSIEEIPVNHRERFAGESKYTNWDRALRGIYDLIGVSWLLKRIVKFDIASEDEGDSKVD